MIIIIIIIIIIITLKYNRCLKPEAYGVVSQQN